MVIFRLSRYRCQNTGENVDSPALKPVLRHSLFYFWHFVGYFEFIEGSVSKIQVKTFICQLLYRFYGIRYSIFSTLEIILSRSNLPLPRYRQKCSFAGFKTGFTAFAVLFLALWRSFLVNRRYLFPTYRRKRSFAAFKPVLRLSVLQFSRLTRRAIGSRSCFNIGGYQ